MRSLDQYTITLKHLVIAFFLALAGYVAANLYVDHVMIRAIIGQLEDVTRTVNEISVGR